MITKLMMIAMIVGEVGDVDIFVDDYYNGGDGDVIDTRVLIVIVTMVLMVMW